MNEKNIQDYSEQIIQEYCANNYSKMKKVVENVLRKFSWLPQKDHDECYSLANEVLYKVSSTYDGGDIPFDGIFYNALYSKFCTYLTATNTTKRSGCKRDPETGKPIVGTGYKIVSYDEVINEDTETTICDTVASDYNLESEVFNSSTNYSQEMAKYLDVLSPIQREILQLKVEKVPVDEIKKKLKLSNRQYENLCNDLKSFSKINILFSSEPTSCATLGEGKDMVVVSQKPENTTLEKSKTVKLSVESIIKKMDKQLIRFNHPLQRESEQWTPAMKGNLVSDVLQGNPIPQLVFAEQVINGIAIIWDLDGKQRCTIIYSFVKGGFKISKNIRRYMIEYQTQVKNEDGTLKFDEDGFPIYERKEFDIRNKYFKDLPEELQEVLMDYTFEIVQYLNCSSEDIAYHIARYNEGKPMTASQKGITRVGEEFASMIKSISRMPFFKDMGGYKVSEVKNGTLERVVVESIMAAKYLDSWKKKLDEMCEFVKDNATIEDFDNFEDMITRLEAVVTDDVADMFNSKDSFLWFGLFARFTKSGLDDIKFVDFMAEFAQSLHTKEVDGITFDDLNGKSTKDKNVVVNKLNHLEALMNEFCGVEVIENEEVVSDKDKIEDNTEVANTNESDDATSAVAVKSEKELVVTDQRLVDFYEKFKKSDLLKNVKDERLVKYLTFKSLQMFYDKDLEGGDIQEFINQLEVNETDLDDIDLYKDMLDSWTLDVDNDSELLDATNVPELIRVVKYIFDLSIDDDMVSGWLKEYSSNYIARLEDSASFYNDMIDSLNHYVEKHDKKVA